MLPWVVLYTHYFVYTWKGYSHAYKVLPLYATYNTIDSLCVNIRGCDRGIIVCMCVEYLWLRGCPIPENIMFFSITLILIASMSSLNPKLKTLHLIDCYLKSEFSSRCKDWLLLSL